MNGFNVTKEGYDKICEFRYRGGKDVFEMMFVDEYSILPPSEVPALIKTYEEVSGLRVSENSCAPCIRDMFRWIYYMIQNYEKEASANAAHKSKDKVSRRKKRGGK